MRDFVNEPRLQLLPFRSPDDECDYRPMATVVSSYCCLALAFTTGLLIN